MTPERQRIAIAEWCGWVSPVPPSVLWTFNNGNQWADADHLPDYLNDLNAMWHVEENLHPVELDKYTEQLYMVLERFWTIDRWVKFNRLGIDYAFAHATAAQRAEALLRTIGKWKD